jgi:hypothetical protein
MISKKLFTPKCQHLDRDIVFHEDLDNFFIDFISHIKLNIKNFNKKENKEKEFLNKINENKESEKFESENFNENKNYNLFNKDNINNKNDSNSLEDNLLKNLSYKIFKNFWNEKKMSMLHFSKSKEENPKEYYEVLFGEIQSFLIENNLLRKKEYNKIHIFLQVLTIYSMYSLYFTQTTDFFYQINTIPEYLLKINLLLSTLIKKGISLISKELLLMVNRLHKNSAFSIGIIPGLKTIILNKYGLPIEKKINNYKDLMDIHNSQRKLYAYEDDDKINELINKYQSNKFNTLKLIKNEINKDKNNNNNNDYDLIRSNKDIYCDFINYKNNSINAYKNDLSYLKIDKNEFDKNINNLDLQFNFFD